MAVVISVARKVELRGDLENDIAYHFEWKPNSLTLSDVIAKITKKCLVQSVSEVQLHGFENTSLKNLKKLLRTSKNRFEVKLESSPCASTYKVHLYLKPVPDLIVEQEAPLPGLNILSVNYIHELVAFLRDSTDELRFEILKSMVKFFRNLPGLNLSQVKEMVAVIGFLEREDFKEVLRKLFFLCNRNSIYLEHLTEALSHIKRNNSEFDWSQAAKSEVRLQNYLEIDDCLELISLVHSHLNNSDTERRVYYLRALIILLEFAKNLGLFNKATEHQLCSECKNKIRKFKKIDNITIKFLILYSNENLKFEQNSQKINYLMLFLFAENSRSLSPSLGPWKFLANRPSLPIDRLPIKVLERVVQTFILFQTTYLLKRNDFLLDFNHFICDALSTNKMTGEHFERTLGISHDYYFIEGWIELMRSLIDLHAYDDIKVVQDAINLLLKIRNDNSTLKNGNFLHFRVNRKMTRQQTHITDRVDTILKHCIQSPNPTVVLAAKQSLSKFNGTSAPETIPLNELPKCQLFEQGVRSVAPYIIGLKLMKDRLESEQQESPISATAILPGGETNCLETALKSYLRNSQNKAVFICGEPGSGKSFSIKQIALNYLKNFQSDAPLPLFTSLKELINPQKKFIEESLKKYEILECANLLQQKKIVWFIDGFDAVFKDASFNFYSTNSLDRWPNAQFIVTCVNKVFKSCFNPNLKVRVMGDTTSLTVQQLEIAPLNNEQQYRLIQNRLIQRMHLSGDIFSKSEYRLLMEKLELLELTSNPRFLTSLLGYFPEIFKKNVKDLPSKSQILEKLMNENT